MAYMYAGRVKKKKKGYAKINSLPSSPRSTVQLRSPNRKPWILTMTASTYSTSASVFSFLLSPYRCSILTFRSHHPLDAPPPPRFRASLYGPSLSLNSRVSLSSCTILTLRLSPSFCPIYATNPRAFLAVSCCPSTSASRHPPLLHHPRSFSAASSCTLLFAFAPRYRVPGTQVGDLLVGYGGRAHQRIRWCRQGRVLVSGVRRRNPQIQLILSVQRR